MRPLGQPLQILKMKRIDLEHKRFLILQGEVESISLMKPKTVESEKFTQMKLSQQEKENCEAVKNEILLQINEENELMQKRTLLYQIERFVVHQSIKSSIQSIAFIEEKCDKAHQKLLEETEKYPIICEEVSQLEKIFSERQLRISEFKPDLDASQRRLAVSTEERKSHSQKSKKLTKPFKSKVKQKIIQQFLAVLQIHFFFI